MPLKIFNRLSLWISLVCQLALSTTYLRAQNDIVLQEPVYGKVEVSAPGSITLKPGFHAMPGSDFHAYIGVNQGKPDTTSIPPTVGSGTSSGSKDQNYIKEITFREPRTEMPTDAFEHTETIKYYDGLGRPAQTVMVGASPAGNDIIQPVLYDDFGRGSVITLPYTASKTGEFRKGTLDSMKSIVNAYYTGTVEGRISDSRAFTSIGYDNSPLNRVVSRMGPGLDWETNNKKVQINYLSNEIEKPGWNVTGDFSYSSFSYQKKQLYVTETIDEDGNITREYKDKQGQVVLKESRLGSNWLRTAYIFDDFGLLRCVVPPQASGPEDTALCYYYMYDGRKRMVEKRIPGAGSMKMVYDKRDRLRFTQDAKQAGEPKEWTFMKYDALNRPVITGTIINTADASAIKASIDLAAMNETLDFSESTGYTSQSFPLAAGTILTVTYYDNYDYIDSLKLDVKLKSASHDEDSFNFSSKTDLTPIGQVTGTMTRVLSPSTDISEVKRQELYSALYYDKYGHLLRSISQDHLDGIGVLSNVYADITSQVKQSRQKHYKGTDVITIEKKFGYDHTGRLLDTREKINNQPEITLSAMKYNEVGELMTKYLHSPQVEGSRVFLQKIDYQYNIRGWLISINDPLLLNGNDVFGMQLFYNSTAGMGGLASTGLYSGNISGMKWGIKDDKIRGYQFGYDNLNRMTSGIYAEGTDLKANKDYNSEIITGYDKNGNILGLKRYYNNKLVDSLKYNYNEKSNKLLKIDDNVPSEGYGVDDYPGNSNEYTYDANGNLSQDGSKNLDISYYSSLNLPNVLNFGNDNRIFYHYSATGAKLIKHKHQEKAIDTITHYIGNIVYEGNTLSYILTDEGRLVQTGTGAGGTTFVYEYNLKDHLGNTRVTFRGTTIVDRIQTASYYPFGLVMNQWNANKQVTKNKYLYNGKELQNDNIDGSSLNWYDYGARMYDPQIGRFNSVDPLAEWHYNYNPYHYTFNNPINFSDPFGQDTVKSNKIDWPKFDPDKDIIELPDATVSSNGYTWLGRLFRKIGRALSSGESTYSKPYGEPWTMSDGQGQENARAKIMGPGGNIDLILSVNPDAGFLDLPGVNLERINAGLEKASGAILEATSDRQIVEKSTGTAEKTDAHGKPLEENEYDYRSEGKEPDSSVVQVTYYFNDVDGDTVQDWKVKKNTSNGRPVSKKYIKKTK